MAQWLDHRATFLGRWGLKPVKDGPDYEELVATEGMPRLRMWLDRITTEQLANFSVVYGYFPVHSETNTLVVGDPDDPSRELTRFDFPRQRRDPGSAWQISSATRTKPGSSAPTCWRCSS